jgi:fumarate hydratase class II
MSLQENEQLWGGETTKAIGNFPISGEPVPIPVVRWLGRIKGAAARVNAELELLDSDMADRVAAAADRVAAGEFDDQFPIDVFQTGSGTSTNMNANEVIANLAGDPIHPNDHVNMGQSSNDVFPSAVHLAALQEASEELLPALARLERAFQARADEFRDIVKSGRTHLMDAVPVTLGQEFSGYAAQIRLAQTRVRNALPQVAQIPLGGTATGTGLNTHPEFAQRVRARLSADTGLEIRAPEDPFEAQGNRDALVELSGALKVIAVSLTKIANDLALMGSGPRAGIGEILLPELQKGSSIMPGKVNPVLPEVVLQVCAQVIGNDAAKPAAVDPTARQHLQRVRGEVRRGHSRQRGGLSPLGGVDARRCDGAEPIHRLRPGRRDRQGGRVLGSDAARGRLREGRRRGDLRQGHGPQGDGAGQHLISRVAPPGLHRPGGAGEARWSAGASGAQTADEAVGARVRSGVTRVA